jgi:hypothetical protein
MNFKIINIFSHSTGYKQIELIDEPLFSATKEDQKKFAFSIVRPEAENFKEGDMIESIG